MAVGATPSEAVAEDLTSRTFEKAIGMNTSAREPMS
jgi:hypothetical protein